MADVKVLFFNAPERKWEERLINGNVWDSTKKIINCDMLEILPVQNIDDFTSPHLIGLCDEEARLKEGNLQRLFSKVHNYPMAGSVVFVKTYEHEEADQTMYVSLDDLDIKIIKELYTPISEQVEDMLRYDVY